MSTSKNIDKICIVVLVLTIIITLIFVNGEKLGIKVVKSEDDGGYFTENDLNGSVNRENATDIVLKKDSAEIKGNGAYTADGNLYIVSGGDYVLSGELADGSIIINAEKNEKIRLIFDSVNINCNDNATLISQKADKVLITLNKGTENSLTSGEKYSDEAQKEKTDGCIYSKTDLTVNGEGKLNIKTDYCHGMVCNDDLIITGGDISVTAKEDAVHANDSVRITKANLNLSAGDDGITVSNDKSTDYLYVESGKINIEKCYEGLEATTVTVKGGDISVKPQDDGLNAEKLIEIDGGNICVINDNGKDADGFDSNKDIKINGGNIFISVPGDSSTAFDYGSENNGKCLINGGTVTACGGSSMLEEISSESKQAFIVKTVSGDAESQLVLKSSDGKELVSEIVPIAYSAVVLSTPDIKIGSEYSLIVGKSEEKITAEKGYKVSSGFGGKGNKDFGREENSEQREKGGENPPQMPDFNGEMPDGMQPPEKPDGESDGFPSKPDFNGEFQENMPERGNGTKPPEMPDNEDKENANQKNPEKSFDNKNVPEKLNNADNREEKTKNTYNKSGFVLIGISVFLLITGIIIAVKKKY